MTKLHELAALGQSVWYDYIRRSLITSGELQRLLDQGVRGMTSNPTIFEKAIAGSSDYDDDLRSLVAEGKSVKEIYEALALDDIGHAADLLRPLYDETDGADGYVSIEVSPKLAHDTSGTVEEARRLYAALDRPNIMIKVPGTAEGIPAIETLISDGISINVTLLFSAQQYEPVIEAFLAGLERRVRAGQPVKNIASVASFFVSRVDTAVDAALEAAGNSTLLGKIAVANARVAYALFQQKFQTPRWEFLAGRGAQVQRPLWASTSTKNPAYSDTLYIDTLIGPDTVNTMPPQSVTAFMDHGTVALTIEQGMDEARQQMVQLAAVGVDLKKVTAQLQDEGVASFAKSFDSLMDSIAAKREKLLAEFQSLETHLGPFEEPVQSALAEINEQRIVDRLWQQDYTIWSDSPDEITNRLGWLHIAEMMQENVRRIYDLVEALGSSGYTHALLLGMGGSSLAPEVFRKTYGVRTGYLDLDVLDTTDPDKVRASLAALDLAKTLFIVSTKSGGTVETLSGLKFFYNQVISAVGQAQAGEHFIAITDPGSSLEPLARDLNFREIYINDPNIGGRYSALSYFGLVPAALVGVDLERLLRRALAMSANNESCAPQAENMAATLGAILGELANAGRDKLTLVLSPAIASFGDWVEQLIAESTGKKGKGILPVVGEPLADPAFYGQDRLFVYLQLAADNAEQPALDKLVEAGHPLVQLRLNDLYDLGGQFFLWEMATAIAGYRLGIQPFDQPNVESAKVQARKMVAEYAEKGALPPQTPALTDDGISVYGSGVTASSAAEALKHFVEQGTAGDYITLMAYVQPMPETDAALAALRLRLREMTTLATTTGYGPRFLHSTGQLHKGDGGHGLFIQFTSDPVQDVPIPDAPDKPDSSMSFGVLKMAQALGDRQALLGENRRVIRLHLGQDVPGSLNRLLTALS